MSPTRLFHNPRCSKSRESLELLRQHGIEPEIVDYLHSPPSATELRALLRLLGTGARGLLRTGEPEYQQLGLADADDTLIIEAMAAHPRLIERPVFLRGGRAVIGRPPERVLELLAGDSGAAVIGTAD